MLPDVQNEADIRGVALDEVGISGLRYPTEFTDGATRQAGIGSFDVVVTLPSDRRGTHMSRMVQLVQEQLAVIDPRELPVIMKQVAARMDIDRAHVRVALPIATAVVAPVSGLKAFQASDLHLSATIDTGSFTLITSVTAQVTSLCPCSKTISDYGAHNQRSDVKVSVFGTDGDPYPLNVADLVHLIRASGSCPVYPVVKRPDERAITMTAYDNPAFVEDMARDLSLELRRRNVGHSVNIRNLESIHSHDAVASVSWTPAALSAS
ncbi:GTP cyclohydrolase I [Arthrobacter pascens]|uniref:GTP cyclohydrolase FolE2 n=1 Tax=Arthrobacter pascens TaxID=1677 RepID=UPI0027943261|nr:GTP cyclohydrolase FolE2 [Arthrobacter pascens]MDQ0679688.1 GTP cyclohydrolase I [Arthrobacter pascens]